MEFKLLPSNSYFEPEEKGALVGIFCSLLMVAVGFSFQALSKSFYFNRQFRRILLDYGTPISLVASSGVAYRGSQLLCRLEVHSKLLGVAPGSCNSGYSMENGSGLLSHSGFVLWIFFSLTTTHPCVTLFFGKSPHTDGCCGL